MEMVWIPRSLLWWSRLPGMNGCPTELALSLRKAVRKLLLWDRAGQFLCLRFYHAEEPQSLCLVLKTALVAAGSISRGRSSALCTSTAAGGRARGCCSLG